MARRTRTGAYVTKLSDSDVLTLLKLGIYRAEEDGTILGRKGRRITPFVDRAGYRFVRLYYRGGKRIIAVGKLVWMAFAKRTIPVGFEIHHDDLDPSNNSWRNLFCFHRDDHRKIHAEGDAPF